MKKNKNKIIAAVIILAALFGAWLWGGSYNNRNNASQRNMAQVSQPPSQSGDSVPTAETPDTMEAIAAGSPTPRETAVSSGTVSPYVGREASDDALDPAPDNDNEHISDTQIREQSGEAIASGEERLTSGQSAAEESASQSESSSDENTDTDLDRYQTSQVPDGRPAPVEPQDMTAGDDSFTVTLTVRCDMILSNMNLLNREKHELVPEDGVIFPETTITAYEGESVFNVLQREMRRAGIHMTFRNTPIYNSAYIEAVNNLYEFDVGELSGWMYKVNGWFPNYGCSRYKLQPGDVIEWHYTCDLGRDLGENWLGSGWGQMDD